MEEIFSKHRATKSIYQRWIITRCIGDWIWSTFRMSRPSLQPLASTPSPPFSSLSFLPSVSRTYQPLSKKRKSAHATQLANVTVLLEAPARGSAIFRHIEIEKCRLDARRSKVMENTVGLVVAVCRCCPMELQISKSPSYEFICRLCTR